MVFYAGCCIWFCLQGNAFQRRNHQHCRTIHNFCFRWVIFPFKFKIIQRIINTTFNEWRLLSNTRVSLPNINIIIPLESMRTSLKYQYDFFCQQSLTDQQFRRAITPIKTQTRNYNYENQLLHASESFLKVECLKSDELRRLTKCIFKLDVFKRLGLLLFEVCLIEFDLITNIDKCDRLQTIRQGIYDHLQELIVVFGKDKDRYLPIVPLVYCAIIKKMFTVTKKLINADQKYKIFHVVFFELKGQLVSDQFLQELINKHFNDNYNRFIKEFSENITPSKPIKSDLSNTKPVRKAQTNIKLEHKYFKQNKQNTPTAAYQTNRKLMERFMKDQRNISPLLR